MTIKHAISCCYNAAAAPLSPGRSRDNDDNHDNTITNNDTTYKYG